MKEGAKLGYIILGQPAGTPLSQDAHCRQCFLQAVEKTARNTATQNQRSKSLMKQELGLSSCVTRGGGFIVHIGLCTKEKTKAQKTMAQDLSFLLYKTLVLAKQALVFVHQTYKERVFVVHLGLGPRALHDSLDQLVLCHALHRRRHQHPPKPGQSMGP
jgi:hypothetical protein